MERYRFVVRQASLPKSVVVREFSGETLQGVTITLTWRGGGTRDVYEVVFASESPDTLKRVLFSFRPLVRAQGALVSEGPIGPGE